MTDSTLPAASFNTAATWNVFRTHVVSALTCKRYAVGTIVTEATTGGVAVVLSLLHAAKIAVAATTPTSTRFMHCSLQLLCRAPVVPPRSDTSPGGGALVPRNLPLPRHCRLRSSRPPALEAS